MNLKLIDCHTHTTFSPDGESSPEAMCEKAIELGLSAYAITDHCECSTWFEEDYYRKKGVPKSNDPFVEYDYKNRFYNAVNNMRKLKFKYEEKLNLICGIELGQATQGYLKSLTVSEGVLKPNFSFDIYDYHVDVDEDVEICEIEGKRY